MFDFTKTCVFLEDDSPHDSNLNTIMEIVVQDKKCKVAICSECEDEATPKKIKAVVSSKLDESEKANKKLEVLRAAAAELGFDLIKSGDGDLMIPVAKAKTEPTPEPPSPISKPQKPLSTIKVDDNTFKVQRNSRRNKPAGLSKEEANAALEAAKRASTVGPNESPTPGQAPSYRSHVIPESVKIKTPGGEKTVEGPITWTKEMQVVRGRAGVPTTIPKSISSTDGKTNITIVNTGGDKTIRRRAEQLNHMRSVGDDTYYSRDCVVCAGSGHQGARSCHTCKGSGIIIA